MILELNDEFVINPGPWWVSPDGVDPDDIMPVQPPLEGPDYGIVLPNGELSSNPGAFQRWVEQDRLETSIADSLEFL